MRIDLFQINTRAVATDPVPDEGGSYFGLRVDIVFGMPKYNCRFHGICKLDVDENDLLSPILPQCGRGKGRLFIPHPAYTLICFDKQYLTMYTRFSHFDQDHFELKEAVPFSIALTQRLGKRYNLLPGCYRIKENEEVYSVLFRMNSISI